MGLEENRRIVFAEVELRQTNAAETQFCQQSSIRRDVARGMRQVLRIVHKARAGTCALRFGIGTEGKTALALAAQAARTATSRALRVMLRAVRDSGEARAGVRVAVSVPGRKSRREKSQVCRSWPRRSPQSGARRRQAWRLALQEGSARGATSQAGVRGKRNGPVSARRARQADRWVYALTALSWRWTGSSPALPRRSSL